jgi:di/tricarboxylate transporter
VDPHAWITVATLVAAVVLLVTKGLPMEATALSIPVVLVATGTPADPDLALGGFSNHAVNGSGAGCAFTLPFGNQYCLKVTGPGGHSPKDHPPAGGGLSVLTTATTVFLPTIR